MHRRIDPALTARARELRNNPTETELAVWHLISRYRPSFTRQHILVHAAECLGDTHPQPLPSREGRERRPRLR